MSPIEKYKARVEAIDSLLCVGLDADFAKIPARFQTLEHPQFEFNKWIIDATHVHASAFKINSAFYEARGHDGIKDLKMTMDYVHQMHPDIFTILDAKRGDIGNTNEGYVQFAFDWLGFDALTLHPYLGREALEPFLRRNDKVSIILARTSNAGAGEFQDLSLGKKLLWLHVVEKIASEWNTNQNCMIVMGATYPQEIAAARKAAPDLTFLVPGIGAQGGSVEQVVRSGLAKDNRSLIINSSRGIIFSENPGQEAKRLKEEINYWRTTAFA